ncbi:hypothetical protein K438DRAFT_1928286 [Mycena galopus ATCC 62051]|nr:hypothetical protein K438DRAFT_1928286 [Mycena galopus ATCC 62051]
MPMGSLSGTRYLRNKTKQNPVPRYDTDSWVQRRTEGLDRIFSGIRYFDYERTDSRTSGLRKGFLGTRYLDEKRNEGAAPRYGTDSQVQRTTEGLDTVPRRDEAKTQHHGMVPTPRSTIPRREKKRRRSGAGSQAQRTIEDLCSVPGEQVKARRAAPDAYSQMRGPWGQCMPSPGSTDLGGSAQNAQACRRAQQSVSGRVMNACNRLERELRSGPESRTRKLHFCPFFDYPACTTKENPDQNECKGNSTEEGGNETKPTTKTKPKKRDRPHTVWPISTVLANIVVFSGQRTTTGRDDVRGDFRAACCTTVQTRAS